MVVNVEATTDAIDYRQLKPALERCVTILGQRPKQIVADGDYTNHASVQVAADCGVDFYGSWQDSWKPTERCLWLQWRLPSQCFSLRSKTGLLYLSCRKAISSQLPVPRFSCRRSRSRTLENRKGCGTQHATGVVQLDNAFVLIKGSPVGGSGTQEPIREKGRTTRPPY